VLTNVCFAGKNGHDADVTQCLLMTHSGHWQRPVWRAFSPLLITSGARAVLSSPFPWLSAARLTQGKDGWAVYDACLRLAHEHQVRAVGTFCTPDEVAAVEDYVTRCANLDAERNDN
jgi:hypothetical protein